MSLKMVLSGFLNLLEKIEMRRKLNEDAYDLEFQKLKMLTENLKHNPDYTCKHGAQEINRCKNRYKDILPYDYTRVILTEDSDKPGSDYTNANYIKGANGSAAYIACQGPLPHTVVDFWRMIWECEVKVVVMACNEKESGKQKCENYWPEDEAKEYGNFHVELIKTQYVCNDFLIRVLKTYYEDEERMVYQFHYTTWPDHGVPTSVEPILHLIQLVRKFQASDSVPILVHCSAGCGRTGTICAIDYVWRLMISGRLKEPFNLYEIISKMRQQRIAMVQTKEQYILVHRAVAALFEQQLELIAHHFYENINENGHPRLVQDLEKEKNIYEEVNCKSVCINFNHHQNEESVEEQQHETTIDDCQKECPPINDELHGTIAHSQSAILSIGKNCVNTTVDSMNGQLKNLHEFSVDTITEPSAHEQNVNFTLSLPLSAVKQKSKNSSAFANADHNTNLVIENCVSCNVKIDSKGKVQVLQQKEDDSLQPNSPCYLSNCTTNPEKGTDCCNIGKLHYSAITGKYSNDDLIPCQIAQNSKTLPFKCSTEKCESNDDTMICQRGYSDVKEKKYADIEEIFQKILSSSQNQMSSDLVMSEKQFNLVRPPDSWEETTKIDKNSLVTKASKTEMENIKCESIEDECAKVVSAKHKECKIEKNVVSNETSEDIVLHNIANGCTQASRKRYMSLVTECEQSFSEIERLLEEKNKSLTIQNTHHKESSNVIFPEIANCDLTCEAVHCSKLYNVMDNDKTCTPQNKKYTFVSEKEIDQSVKISESASFSDISTIRKQPGKEVINTVSCNNLHIQSDPIVNKNNITPENTKQKCFGIEEALKKNQADDDSLEYIDSVVISQDIYHEKDVANEQLEMKRSFSETEINSFSLKSGKIDETEKKLSILRSKVNDTMLPPNIKIIKCNVRTEISRKEGTAHKRTGKIFEHEEIFPHLNQGKLSNINIPLKCKENKVLSFPCKEDRNIHKEEEGDPIVFDCTVDKENSQPNSQAASKHNTCNNTNISGSCESENLVDCTTEASGAKATVIRRPSIAKLKALFEKTVPAGSHSDKHRERHPLSRSQSHHIHRYKATDKDSLKEKYSTKPTLLDKMTKILHLPSVENNYCQADDNRLSVQWKSSDMEAISFSLEPKEISKPLVDAKVNENKSEWHDNIKDRSKSDEKLTNCSLLSDKGDICNPIENCEDKESISERSAVGCLDFSSLMSVVTKEQCINKTHWYEHERNDKGKEDQVFDKKKVPYSIHSEEIKEQCNANNDIHSKEVKTASVSVIDSVEFPCKLAVVNSAKNDLPPELPTKKKYQNASFCSYIKDEDYTDNNMQNLFHDSATRKTKWYYENDENSSTDCELQIESLCDDTIACSDTSDSNVNKNISTISDQNKFQSMTSSQILGHSEVNMLQHCDLQPPLPPKKKSNDVEKEENTNWFCNEIKAVFNYVKSGDVQNKSSEFHPYVNVLKTKDGILMTDEEETNQLLHIVSQSKPDLYTNVNTTSMKNIEQIENSLQQHPRGAIIDLTSRQSYANEQQSDVTKSIKYGSDPKLSETVITTDLEESHYNNEKPICHNFTEKVLFKLRGNKYETISLAEKNNIKKHYETIWPQKETDEQIANIRTMNINPVYNQDTQTDIKSKSLLHNSSLDLKNSDINKLSPPPKPRSPALGKVLSKSKSSSALFSKIHDKNSVSNDNSKFKDMSVNKVVCELNSILNVLTTRPFKSAQKETSSSSEKSSDAEMAQNRHRQSNLNHPLAPPRRKPRNDGINCATHVADLELHGPYASVIKSFKLPEKCVITNANLKPNIHHISKSATMSDINKAQFIDPRKKNISYSKEKCAKIDNPIGSQFVENSSRLPFVYENVDCVQSNIVSLENDMKNVLQKPSGKINKLKHSSSDTSVFSVLRKTKCLNKDKVLTNQGQQNIPQEAKDKFKSETKSYIKRQSPVIKKQIITPMTDKMRITKVQQQNSPIQNKQQLIACPKKTERRSMDDMDAFPVAPPRTRRHGPTPQKTVAEMEKFTSSLDEGKLQKLPSS